MISNKKSSVNDMLHQCLSSTVALHCPSTTLDWGTDFYTPPVLGSAALFGNSAPAVWLPIMMHPSKLAPLVCKCSEVWKIQISPFRRSLFTHSLLLRAPTLKNKNRGLRPPALSAIVCLKIAFLGCTNSGLISHFCVPLSFFGVRFFDADCFC